MNTAKINPTAKTMDMCNGPLVKNILLFALPLMLSRVAQLLFNAADVIVVSKFCGETALAAVGSTGSLINLMLNLLLGMSVATNILTARSIGEKRFDMVSKFAHTAILISLCAGVVFAVIGACLARPALRVMNSPEDVIDLSTLYIQIYCAGVPASMVYNFGSALLNAKGDTKRPLNIILVSGVINVVLNVIFVTLFNMSVDGVALATIISQYISAVRIVLCLVNDESNIRIDFRKLRFHKDCIKETLKVGIPTGLNGMTFSLSNIVVQSAVNSLGEGVMAAFAAANNLQGFLYTACNAFYNATLTFASQNVGAGNWNRVKKVLYTNMAFVVAAGISIAGIAFLFAKSLLSIYITDPSIIEIGVECAKYIWLPVFLCGVMEIYLAGVRSMGYSTTPMIVSMFGTCGLRILWVYIIFDAWRTVGSLFSVYSVSWIITAIAHAVCFYIIFAKKKRMASEKILNA